jgi:hypothetical protein
MIRHYMNLRKETSALLGKFVRLKEMLGYFRKTRCLGREIYRIRIYSIITVYYMHRHENMDQPKFMNICKIWTKPNFMNIPNHKYGPN